MYGNEDKLAAIKRRVERGEYRIDVTQIADAIIRRVTMWPPSELPAGAPSQREARRTADADDEAQSECSYPESFRVVSRKTAPGGPSRTRPITARSPLVGSRAA
jgi:Anti-sigma-28 factor, FlgM